MDGALGRRALNLLKGAVGVRGTPTPYDEPMNRPDDLEHPVGHAGTTNGHDLRSDGASPTADGGGAPEHLGGAVAPCVSADELRRELQAALAAIFSSAADAIVTVDEQHRIMMLNRAAEQLFGCSNDEALGTSVDRFVSASLLTPDPDRDRRLAETGVAGWRLGEVAPLTAVRLDGGTIPIEATVTPVTVRGQQLFTAVIRDASARVRMEDELRQVNRRLAQALADVQQTQEVMIRQERLKALGQLASGIAHDFNNALAMIIGFAELLLADGDTPAETGTRRAHLQLIHSAAQDAATVGGRLRELSRPRSPSTDLPPVQLNDLVAQAISLS